MSPRHSKKGTGRAPNGETGGVVPGCWPRDERLDGGVEGHNAVKRDACRSRPKILTAGLA